jgi:mannose-6-phosphate isomerase
VTLYPLENTIRPYAWGSHTVLADIQGRPSPTDRPEAELWIGAHPTAPSRTENGTLLDLINDDPGRILGPYGTRLPFLLKVLAVEHPLSLQVHPDPEQAKEGFAKEEAAGIAPDDPHRSYHDDQPKPELISAVTPFTALCGWADPAESAGLLAGLGIPALDKVIADLRADRLKDAVQTLLTWPEQDRETLVSAVRTACMGRDDDRSTWTSRLADEYPKDTGVVTSMLLNLVHLAPGQALYLPGRTIHAYLHGTGVEVMAGSDNVLRGGLTPKYVNVTELLAITDFRAVRTQPLSPEPTGSGGETYPTPAPQFRLTRYRLPGAVETTLDAPGPGAILCLEGEITVRRGKDSLALTPGRAAFLPYTGGSAVLTGHGLVYHATPGLTRP